MHEISSVQSLSHFQLSDSHLTGVVPWTTALKASRSITNSWSLLKLMSIMLVMPSNHLILCHPFLLLPSVFPSIRVFSNELVLCIRWPKYWSFSFSISPSNEYSRLLSFRMDWLDLLAVQGTLKSLKIYGTVNSNCRFSWHQRMSAKSLIIKDQKWQCDLCFLTDTTLHMNEFNLKLREGKVCYLNRQIWNIY